MNNADAPEMPVPLGPGEALDDEMNPNGLTKREHIATKFAAAMMVNAGRNGYRNCTDPALIKDAWLAAEAFLAEQERTS